MTPDGDDFIIPLMDRVYCKCREENAKPATSVTKNGDDVLHHHFDTPLDEKRKERRTASIVCVVMKQQGLQPRNNSRTVP